MYVSDPMPERDAPIAATASVHGPAVVTRSIEDFQSLDVPVINPWARVSAVVIATLASIRRSR